MTTKNWFWLRSSFPVFLLWIFHHSNTTKFDLSVMESGTEMATVLHMNDGIGENTYARNSSIIQKSGLIWVKPIFQESISSINIIQHLQTLCIADLGCSCGPNTLLAIEAIVKAVETKCGKENIPIPQIQVFCNDLPSNDFNSLFRDLPSLIDHLADGVTRRSYFAAGVPGSFHGQLFPANSMHLAHSSYALHWLSQVPAEVKDKNSEAWNKGKICVSEGVPPAVAEAYLRQFRKDFNAFLRARADELVVGGLMFLLVIGRSSDSNPSTGQGFYTFLFETLGHALTNLALQGAVDEERVDSFNLPIFIPSPQEISSEVDAEGSFKILRLEILKRRAIRKEYGKTYAGAIRAGVESLIKFHFDLEEETIDELFDGYANIIANSASEDDEGSEREADFALVLENRK